MTGNARLDDNTISAGLHTAVICCAVTGECFGILENVCVACSGEGAGLVVVAVSKGFLGAIPSIDVIFGAFGQAFNSQSSCNLVWTGTGAEVWL